jgi:hypothetical protein
MTCSSAAQPVEPHDASGIVRVERHQSLGEGQTRRWRHMGFGPRFVRISRELVLYHRSDVVTWAREHGYPRR